ncbi:hypothetical protein [Burkholderia humptydooensis]|nr:hypothetical protein [Burkholderia humptydooensis]
MIDDLDEVAEIVQIPHDASFSIWNAECDFHALPQTSFGFYLLSID